MSALILHVHFMHCNLHLGKVFRGIPCILYEEKLLICQREFADKK